MPISRRDFLKLTAVGALSVSLPGCKSDGTPLEMEEPEEIIPLPSDIGPDGYAIYVEDAVTGPENLFSHGVASGDPTAEAVILWTRVAPVDSSQHVLVFWECAVDEGFTSRRGAGWVAATARHDFTAKADAQSLPPASSLYYRFRAQNRTSIVGRTKTADPTAAEAHFALAACARFEHGFFTAYRAIAELENVDAVLHVGDYIYEYGSDGGGVRPSTPAHEIFTLADYRERFACYRSDSNLQMLHARHPMISVWDDHEVVNDGFSTGMPAAASPSPIDFAARKRNALRAYAEWMPIRVNADGTIHRSFRFGPADLFMLDTRYEARPQQVGVSDRAGLANPERSLLGAAQEAWFEDQLASTSATYCVVAQQIMLAHLALRGGSVAQGGPIILNSDQWDGYQASRSWILDRFETRENVVVLTGDLHVSFASELVRDPWDTEAYDSTTGRGAVAVEILTPGITSPSGLESSVLEFGLQQNPHIRYGEVEHRGFVTVDFDASKMRATFHQLVDARDEASEFLPPVTYTMAAGTHHLVRAEEPVG